MAKTGHFDRKNGTFQNREGDIGREKKNKQMRKRKELGQEFGMCRIANLPDSRIPDIRQI